MFANMKEEYNSSPRGSLCWICEKKIKSYALSPFIIDDGVNASACDRHATHFYRIWENGKIISKEFEDKIAVDVEIVGIIKPNPTK